MERSIDLSDDNFQQAIESFVMDAEAEVAGVQSDIGQVLVQVTKVSVYFYGGDAAKYESEPLKVFVVVKQFLGMLEQACKDVIKANQAPNTTKSPGPAPPTPK